MTPTIGELLLIKRSSHATKAPHEDSQREQLFNSSRTIGGKVYGLIKGGGSFTNVAFRTLINKPQIPTKEHPTPYSIQWFGPNDEVTTLRQALISLSISLIMVKYYVMSFMWMYVTCCLVDSSYKIIM